jgi:osmoprotectant transport system ATP-binding protein
MIKLSKLMKRFEGAAEPVVNGIDLEVGEGEICVLLGPSGCGKTTTLKMINRLVQPTSGKIFIDGADTDTFDVVELRRQIGYVIQQIGLFPNMTIEENLGVVPKLLGWSKDKTHRRAAELLDLVALDPSVYLSRYPKDLSGGQQQRVGVARALAADPPVMLMDEPFGAIDPINRASIQDEFLKLQKAFRKTVVFVSHDIDEAVKMADKIAIFRSGRLEQVAAPETILSRPASPFVADFVGSDRALKRLRLVRASTVAIAAECAVRVGDSHGHAHALMKAHGFDRIAVLDATDRPLGVLSAKRLAVGHATIQAGDVALSDPARHCEDLRAVVSVMFASGRDCLPIVDDQGRFMGYVRQTDIVDMLQPREEVAA